jgi:hypothetical protein
LTTSVWSGERGRAEVRPLVEVRGGVLLAAAVIEDLVAEPSVPINTLVCDAADLDVAVSGIVVAPARRLVPLVGSHVPAVCDLVPIVGQFVPARERRGIVHDRSSSTAVWPPVCGDHPSTSILGLDAEPSS